MIQAYVVPISLGQVAPFSGFGGPGGTGRASGADMAGAGTANSTTDALATETGSGDGATNSSG